MFAQTFDIHDLIIVALLVVLEGVLSIDNALVLGILAKPLPKRMQKKALTYGLAGALIFRTIAVATAAYLLHWHFIKLLGGAYLVWVAAKHFFLEEPDSAHHHEESLVVADGGMPKLIDAETGNEVESVRGVKSKARAFWPTVLVIELTDIAFAVDSIVAAIGVVGPPPVGSVRHPKLWVVLLGGMLGVVLMRFAAVLFIKLLDRFPRFETAAYLLVVVIGLKLVADWGFNTEATPHAIDFHDWRTPAFWIFWTLMIGCFCVGFLPQKKWAPMGKHP